MPLTIAGISKYEREIKARQVLISLGLEDKIAIKANKLSGGQKQRVAIARALVNNPTIILADEPTGNLDSQNADEIISIFRKIVEDGRTVILVTHNIDYATKADNVVEIKDGIVFANYLEKYQELFE